MLRDLRRRAARPQREERERSGRVQAVVGDLRQTDQSLQQSSHDLQIKIDWMATELNEAIEQVSASFTSNIPLPAAGRSESGSANERRASMAGKWRGGLLSQVYARGMYDDAFESIDNVSEDVKALLAAPLA